MITSILIAPFVFIVYIIGLAILIALFGSLAIGSLIFPIAGIPLAIVIILFGLTTIVGWTGTCIMWVCEGDNL